MARSDLATASVRAFRKAAVALVCVAGAAWTGAAVVGVAGAGDTVAAVPASESAELVAAVDVVVEGAKLAGRNVVGEEVEDDKA